MRAIDFVSQSLTERKQKEAAGDRTTSVFITLFTPLI